MAKSNVMILLPQVFLWEFYSFRSYIYILIDFEFVFMCGIRECSILILLHVWIQYSQHHLMKRLSFLHTMSLAPLSKITWVYICVGLLLVSLLSYMSSFSVMSVYSNSIFSKQLTSLKLSKATRTSVHFS